MWWFGVQSFLCPAAKRDLLQGGREHGGAAAALQFGLQWFKPVRGLARHTGGAHPEPSPRGSGHRPCVQDGADKVSL